MVSMSDVAKKEKMAQLVADMEGQCSWIPIEGFLGTSVRVWREKVPQTQSWCYIPLIASALGSLPPELLAQQDEELSNAGESTKGASATRFATEEDIANAQSFWRATFSRWDAWVADLQAGITRKHGSLASCRIFLAANAGKKGNKKGAEKGRDDHGGDASSSGSQRDGPGGDAGKSNHVGATSTGDLASNQNKGDYGNGKKGKGKRRGKKGSTTPLVVGQAKNFGVLPHPPARQQEMLLESCLNPDLLVEIYASIGFIKAQCEQRQHQTAK
ncbi:unnamed protein product [Amoebophrya sp. A25]|nr:unnamed protein product [Amoebophrya sp. A25]|eukprot:GSA25T00014598001.1